MHEHFVAHPGVECRNHSWTVRSDVPDMTDVRFVENRIEHRSLVGAPFGRSSDAGSLGHRVSVPVPQPMPAGNATRRYRCRMAATVFSSIDQLTEAVGSHLGYSSWLDITQDRIDRFADATNDHQWIHVDADRASEGPFGTTIAHGFLTLSLAVPLVSEIYRVEGVERSINYGVNKVRFPAPVPVGSRLRASATLADVEPIEGGAPVVVDVVFEIDGESKPVCVAQTVSRFYR